MGVLFMRQNEARFLSCMYVLSLTLLVLFAVHGIRAPVMVSGEEETRPVVILDAGHGGPDGGASSGSGTLESTLNLEIVQRTDAVLSLLGERTMLTRDSAEDLSDPDAGTISEKKVTDIRNRVDLVNSQPEAVLISIHQNIYPDAAVHGSQVFYGSEGESKALAEALQENLYRCVDPESHRQAKPAAENIYLMNHIKRPGVLIECGFLSNPEEAARLETPDYQKRLAVVIAVTASNHLSMESEV